MSSRDRQGLFSSPPSLFWVTVKCLLLKELLEESSLPWDGLDLRHQVRAPTKVTLEKTLFSSVFTPGHISTEVKHLS